MAQLLPNGKQTFLDQNGAPLASGYVWFYIPNTTTPKNTWQDSAQTILNLNPVPLDAAGRAIIYGSGVYRQQVYDVNNNLIWDQLTASPASSADLGNTGVPGGAGLIGFDGTTLDQQFLSRVDRVVDSIAALRALAHTTYTRVHVTGYYSAGDHGGGFYWYDPSDTVTADNGGTVIVANDTARWKLEYKDIISIGQFGAKCDGTTNDTAAVTAAFAAAGVSQINVPGMTVIGSSITVPNNLTVVGINGKNCGFSPNANSLTLFTKTSPAVFTDGFVTFESLTFDCKTFSSTTCISFTLCQRTCVTNCVFIGATTPVIIDRGYYHTVRNNYLTPSATVRTGGFVFTSTSDSDYVFLVTCTNNQHFNNGIGHVIGGANFFCRRVIDGDFSFNKTFALTNGTDAAFWFIIENDCQNVRVSNSSVENSTNAILIRQGTGIAVSPSFTKFVNVDCDQAYSGQVIHSAGSFTSFIGGSLTSSGIGVSNSAVFVTGGTTINFSNMTIHGYTGTTTGGGFSLQSCQNVTIDNCTVNASYTFVTIGGSVTSLRAQNNKFINSAGGSAITGSPVGVGNRFSANLNFQIPGSVSSGLPATGVALTNTFGYDGTAYLSGATVTQVNIDGVNLGGAPTSTTTYELPVGSAITLTYTGTPVLNVIGKR